jgi:hypothetical protein
MEVGGQPVKDTAAGAREIEPAWVTEMLVVFWIREKFLDSA